VLISPYLWDLSSRTLGTEKQFRVLALWSKVRFQQMSVI